MILQNDLADSAYKQMDGINFSSFKHFFLSPYHFKWAANNPDKDTDDLIVGNAVHTMCLQPDKFYHKYAVAPKVDRRKTEDKLIWNEFVASCAGKTVLSPEMMDLAFNCAGSIKDNKYFKNLFNENDEIYVESAANCEFAGSMIKGRIDLYNKSKNIIFDIKTCKDLPTHYKVQHIVRDRMYYMQGFFYRTIINANFKPSEPPKVVFGFVHKKPPFTIGLFEFGPAYMDKACYELSDALCRYENCKINDIWPEATISTEPVVLDTHLPVDTDSDIDDID